MLTYADTSLLPYRDNMQLTAYPVQTAQQRLQSHAPYSCAELSHRTFYLITQLDGQSLKQSVNFTDDMDATFRLLEDALRERGRQV